MKKSNAAVIKRLIIFFVYLVIDRSRAIVILFDQCLFFFKLTLIDQ